jgi:hypothetical protein
MAGAPQVFLDQALQDFVAHASVAGWDEARLAYRRAIVEAEPGSAPHPENDVPAWRIRERTKTVAVGIVLCLNLGVDPPDAVKPAGTTIRMAGVEIGISDPALSSQKALEVIAKALQAQYECWQPRARYKLCLDPTLEDVKKACIALRRSHTGKDERLLLHFNGHGVPRPTVNGEIWVFNRSFTQYIPLSVYDLQCWLSTPCILVLDCSNAGRIIDAMLKMLGNSQPGDGRPVMGEDIMILAACEAHSQLPANPALPADLFSFCLTAPLRMALRHSCRNTLVHASDELIDTLPGKLSDLTPTPTPTPTLTPTPTPTPTPTLIRQAERPPLAAGRTPLDLHRGHRCHRMELAAPPPLPPPLPAGKPNPNPDPDRDPNPNPDH